MFIAEFSYESSHKSEAMVHSQIRKKSQWLKVGDTSCKGVKPQVPGYQTKECHMRMGLRSMESETVDKE